ncbi:hypothetical protein [Glutamicibacter sp. X7]
MTEYSIFAYRFEPDGTSGTVQKMTETPVTGESFYDAVERFVDTLPEQEREQWMEMYNGAWEFNGVPVFPHEESAATCGQPEASEG